MSFRSRSLRTLVLAAIAVITAASVGSSSGLAGNASEHAGRPPSTVAPRVLANRHHLSKVGGALGMFAAGSGRPATGTMTVRAGAPLRSALASSKNVLVAQRKLSDNIYEYDYVVSTGNDAYHKVGVHRVVQVEDGQPIASENAIFFAHGDAWNFNAAFVDGTSTSRSPAVYLASKGIDVWGIDFGWTLVPGDTKDFSFMKDWGMQRDIDDLEKALAFARSVRTQTGSPGNRLTLLAWSGGGFTGYGLLNQETQMPKAHRQVRAYIPVDTFFKVNDRQIQANSCAAEVAITNDIANGIYAYSSDFIVQVGKLAKSDPDGPSPLFGPPYTNLQASLTFGAATYQFGPSVAQYYHFVGGTFPQGDIWGIPDGLSYTQIPRWNDFLLTPSPFEPARLGADDSGVACGDTHNSFDNHLKDVNVPVFYVGAGGGFGTGGLYMLTLVGSKDVQSKIISFFAPAQAAFDFGHVDLFHAQNAKSLVWSPIYRWLSQHDGPDN